MRTSVRNLLRALEILAWAVFFAGAIVFLAVRYWLLPNVENYRADIVAAISRSVGLPVEIGALSTDWQGLRPRLSIADVRVYDSDGREALVLPAVENVVAWRSLFVGGLRLHSFVIDGPKLAVRRDADGSIVVGGIRLSSDKGDGKLADWILSQNQILVRGAEIEWLDEARKAPPLKLTALNFRLDNDGDEHQVGIAARPPPALGPGIELRARFDGGSVRQIDKWSGRIYAELGNTNLAGWRAWVDYPINLRRGDGALRIWATLADGRLSQATADVVLSNVLVQLGRELPMLEISAVRGRVYGRETAGGYDFGVRSLSLASPGRATDERHQLSCHLGAGRRHHARAARFDERQPGRARAARAPRGVPAVSGRPARAARRAGAAGQPAGREIRLDRRIARPRDLFCEDALYGPDDERLAQHPGLRQSFGQPGSERKQGHACTLPRARASSTCRKCSRNRASRWRR